MAEVQDFLVWVLPVSHLMAAAAVFVVGVILLFLEAGSLA